MSDIGEMIGRAIVAYILAVAVGAFALGGLMVWGLPKLWHWLKPIIHQVTA